jgi:A/G-specific adenine glycosylase
LSDALTADFGQRLLDWFDHSGRKHLPWQRQDDAYPVWVSEIMLQQTQVATVIPYYQRFMQRFADVHALAEARLDEVLHLWTGLGYYARARNLHRAAIQIVAQHHGSFPRQLEQLMALPGIGRSTAGAILSLAFGQRHAVLDGNVRRVLARCFAVAGHPGQAPVSRQLWQLAEDCLPMQRAGDYNQAMMDLGATRCRRHRPDCANCPLNRQCLALQQDRIADFPGRKARQTLPLKHCRMLLIRNAANELLLAQRPPSGIWGGLWSLPQCDLDQDVHAWLQQHYHLRVGPLRQLQPLEHVFSHFRLRIQPCETRLQGGALMLMKTPCLWYNLQKPEKLGLAAPVVRLMGQYT